MNCEKCGRPIKTMTVFGKTIAMMCDCQRMEHDREYRKKIQTAHDLIFSQLQFQSGVCQRYRPARIENLSPRPGQEEMFEELKSDKFSGALIVGGAGTGKTLTASAYVNTLIAAQANAIPDETKIKFIDCPETIAYITAPCARIVGTVQLMEAIKREYDGGDRVQMERCKTVHTLVIDDIGAERTAEKTNDWSAERIFEIIDYRYGNMLPTIITTNLIPAEIAKRYGDRTADRIRSMCKMIAIKLPSQRKTKG